MLEFLWIFLVQKNLDNFVDYLGYYKNYFASTAIIKMINAIKNKCHKSAHYQEINEISLEDL